MNDSPNHAAASVAERKANSARGLVCGVAAGLAANGSPFLALAAGALGLAVLAKGSRRSSDERDDKLPRDLLLLVQVVLAGYLIGDLLRHWPDIKQAFLDGWRDASR